MELDSVSPNASVYKPLRDLTCPREVFLIGQPEAPRVYIKCRLNGVIIRGLLDTGSERNIIHESLVEKYFGPSPFMSEPHQRIRAVGENSSILPGDYIR